MKALPSWNLKTIRQFLLTSIAQKPCRSPFNEWRRKPGKSISSIQVAVSKAVNRTLSFRLCPGWIPETLPVSKNLRNPLCLNVLIIKARLTPCCATRNDYSQNHYFSEANDKLTGPSAPAPYVAFTPSRPGVRWSVWLCCQCLNTLRTQIKGHLRFVKSMFLGLKRCV